MKKLVSFLAIIALLVIPLSACDIDSLISDTDTSSSEPTTLQDENNNSDSSTDKKQCCNYIRAGRQGKVRICCSK